MSHDTGAHCHCVAEHRPPALELEEHHIWPRYLGGPDTPENRIFICSTTHGNVHELLRLMLRAGRVLPYRELQLAEDRPVSRYAAELAAEGFRRYVVAAGFGVLV